MIVEEGIHVRIFQGWRQDRYILLDEWVNGCEGAVWDYNGGRTFLNGKVYHSMILFDTEEDLLVCKLMFPELLI